MLKKFLSLTRVRTIQKKEKTSDVREIKGKLNKYYFSLQQYNPNPISLLDSPYPRNNNNELKGIEHG